jgi:hypothetical protein
MGGVTPTAGSRCRRTCRPYARPSKDDGATCVYSSNKRHPRHANFWRALVFADKPLLRLHSCSGPLSRVPWQYDKVDPRKLPTCATAQVGSGGPIGDQRHCSRNSPIRSSTARRAQQGMASVGRAIPAAQRRQLRDAHSLPAYLRLMLPKQRMLTACPSCNSFAAFDGAAIVLP